MYFDRQTKHTKSFVCQGLLISKINSKDKINHRTKKLSKRFFCDIKENMNIRSLN